MTADKLPGRLVSLIFRIAEHLPLPEGPALCAQAESANIVDEVPGRSIDVTVPRYVDRVALPDGPVHPIPAVMDGGDVVGELIIWVRDGYLIGAEQPWFGDEPPNAWPEVTALDYQ